jgi:hypothetical protein
MSRVRHPWKRQLSPPTMCFSIESRTAATDAGLARQEKRPRTPSIGSMLDLSSRVEQLRADVVRSRAIPPHPFTHRDEALLVRE